MSVEIKSSEKVLLDSCVSLLKTLEDGDILNLPSSSLKFRQVMYSITKKYPDRKGINFSKILKSKDKFDQVTKVIDIYLKWKNSLAAIENDQRVTAAEDFAALGILSLEFNLPLIWDFQTDLIFISKEYAFCEELILALKKFQHKNIFTFEGDVFIDEITTKKIKKSELQTYFTFLDRAIGLNCKFIYPHENDKNESFTSSVVKIISDVRSNSNTSIRFQSLWLQNQGKSFVRRLQGHSHQDLTEFIERKNILIVAPGPSLANSIELIKENGKKYFTIIATAQAVPALSKFNITPHFVMVVDPEDYSNILNDCKNLDKMSLICEESIHENFLKFPFKNIFTLITTKDCFGLTSIFRVNRSKVVGGTVSLVACSLARELNAASIVLVGQDLCISSGNYFLKGDLESSEIDFIEGERVIVKSIDDFKFNPSNNERVIPILGWSDETLYTTPHYFIYHSQFERFAETKSEIKLFNCSVGGAYIKGFQHQSILHTIQELKEEPVLYIPKLKYNTSNYKNAKLTIEDFENRGRHFLKIINEICLILNKSKILNQKQLSKLSKKELALQALASQDLHFAPIFLDNYEELKRKLAYVESLEENLSHSRNFYKKIYKKFNLYKQYCSKIRSELE